MMKSFNNKISSNLFTLQPTKSKLQNPANNYDKDNYTQMRSIATKGAMENSNISGTNQYGNFNMFK